MAFRKAESLSPEHSGQRSKPPRRHSLRSAARGNAPASVRPESTGAPLPASTQASMSERFGHDFSQVRVHTDSQASTLAYDLSANAYTVGEDILFAEGEYLPGTTSGDKLIAHELTHVAQQLLADGGEGVSDDDQPSEREADTLSAKAIAGGNVDVQSAPDAAVSLDGDDNKDGGGFWSSVWNGMNAEGKQVQDDQSKAWKDLKSGHVLDSGGDLMNSMVSDPLNMLKGGLNSGVDMLEKGGQDSDKKLEDQTKDIPVLGSMIKGLDWMKEETMEGAGGILKGAGDIGAGLINGIAHPLDAASGIEGILEHNSTIPFLGTTLKAAHGLWDFSQDAIYGNKDNVKHEYGNTWGELADHLFNPLTQQKDDMKFDKNLVEGIVAPVDANDPNVLLGKDGRPAMDAEGNYLGKDGKPLDRWKAWKDKPMEAAMRAVTNIAPMVAGMGEADTGALGEVKPPPTPEVPVTPVDPALAPTQPMPAVPTPVDPALAPTQAGVPPTQPMPAVPDAPPSNPALAPTQPGVAPTQPMTPVDPALSPTQPGVAPTQPMTPADPALSPTQPGTPPPGGPTPPGPGTGGPVPPDPVPTGPKNPVQQMPAVNPADVGPSAQPPPGVKNPVVQMPAVNPADIVPGGQPPPGWQPGAVDAPPKGPPPGWEAGPVGGPPPSDPIPSTQMPSTQMPPTQPASPISPKAYTVDMPAQNPVSPKAYTVDMPAQNPLSPPADTVPTPGNANPVPPAPDSVPPTEPAPSPNNPTPGSPAWEAQQRANIGKIQINDPGAPPSSQVPSTQVPSTELPSTQPAPQAPAPAPADAPPSPQSQAPAPATPDSPPSTTKDPPTLPGTGPEGPPPQTLPGVGPPAPPLPEPSLNPNGPPEPIPPTKPSPGVQPAPADAPPSSSQTPAPAAPDSPPSTTVDPPSPGADETGPATKRSPGNPAPAPQDSPPPSSQPPDTSPSSGPATERTSGPNAPDPGSPQADWENQQRANIKDIKINDPDAVSTKPAPDLPAPAPADAPPSTVKDVTPATPDSTPPSSQAPTAKAPTAEPVPQSNPAPPSDLVSPPERGNLGNPTGVPAGDSGTHYGVPKAAWDEQAADWTNQQTGPDADYIKEFLNPSPKTRPGGAPPSVDPNLDPPTNPNPAANDPNNAQVQDWADNMPDPDREYIKKFLKLQ